MHFLQSLKQIFVKKIQNFTERLLYGFQGNMSTNNIAIFDYSKYI